MGAFNSIPDNTATQTFDYYYRHNSTPKINFTATQSFGSYVNDSTPKINVTATQSLSIKEIDLNNYYKNDPRRKVIRCQICKLDISRNDVFKHTVSKRHKYNKLFIAVSQNRCPNGDVDFIVLDIDKLSCRYCNFRLIIGSDSDDIIIVSHIKDLRHIREKQASLNGDGFNNAPGSSAGYSNKLLQPLDSFVTHDIKNRKRMKKKVPKIQKQASSLVKLEEKLKEQRVMNNVCQNTDQEYLLLSGRYQRMWGKELPKCISVGRECYRCTICRIEIPKDILNLGAHINGREHTGKMINNSIQPKIIDVDKRLGGLKIEETATDFKATNNIVKNHISQGSAVPVYQDEIAKFEKKFKDCISLGVDGTATCTACGTEIPNTSKNINEHLNGKKHEEKIVKLIESKKQQLKLEYGKKLIPAPVDFKATNNIVKNHISQGSAVPVYQDEIAKFEKKFKDCISLGVDGTATCTACGTEIPNTSIHINEHLNGRKHEEKIVKLIESKKQQLKLEYGKKLIPAPVDFRDTNNIVENNIPHSSAVYQDEIAEFEKELKDCIRSGENYTSTCTVCGTKIPNTSININDHLMGKKHKEKIVKLIESKRQKLKLKDANKLIPAPVGIVVNGGYKCTICNVWVTNHVKNIKAHEDGKNHVKLMRKREC